MRHYCYEKPVNVSWLRGLAAKKEEKIKSQLLKCQNCLTIIYLFALQYLQSGHAWITFSPETDWKLCLDKSYNKHEATNTAWHEMAIQPLQLPTLKYLNF